MYRLVLPFLLCVDGKTDTGVYTYWFLPCLLGVDEACVCMSWLSSNKGRFLIPSFSCGCCTINAKYSAGVSPRVTGRCIGSLTGVSILCNIVLSFNSLSSKPKGYFQTGSETDKTCQFLLCIVTISSVVLSNCCTRIYPECTSIAPARQLPHVPAQARTH